MAEYNTNHGYSNESGPIEKACLIFLIGIGLASAIVFPTPEKKFIPPEGGFRLELTSQQLKDLCLNGTLGTPMPDVCVDATK